jgi:hypothetical protein
MGDRLGGRDDRRAQDAGDRRDRADDHGVEHRRNPANMLALYVATGGIDFIIQAGLLARRRHRPATAITGTTVDIDGGQQLVA